MQAILVFLAAVAVLGSIGYRTHNPLPKWLLLGLSVLLGLSMYSLRVV